MLQNIPQSMGAGFFVAHPPMSRPGLRETDRRKRITPPCDQRVSTSADGFVNMAHPPQEHQIRNKDGGVISDRRVAIPSVRLILAWSSAKKLLAFLNEPEDKHVTSLLLISACLSCPLHPPCCRSQRWCPGSTREKISFSPSRRTVTISTRSAKPADAASFPW